MARGNIDERIVDMQFNNKQFEAGVKDTLDDLEKLKKGLGSMGKTGGEGMFAGIASGVEGLHVKFSALQMAAFAAIQNIVNRFMDAGVELVKSLTITPITTGWSKYEQKVEATQAIMNATGQTIEQVSAQLEQLNTFVDETSYSFSDMVLNIGKFTGAGIELETAVTSMQGIANWAAISGANTEKASTAMGIMAKAMGMGYLSLKEWRSLESINMTTVEFKQTLLDAAVAVGTLRKQGDEYFTTIGKKGTVTIADFTTNLKDGWANAEVMQKALTEYGTYSNYVLERMSDKGESAADAMRNLAAEGANIDVVFQKMQKEGVDAATAIEMLTKEGSDFAEVIARSKDEGISWADALAQLKIEGALAESVVGNLSKEGTKAQSSLDNLRSKSEMAGIVLARMKKDGSTAQEAIKALGKEGINAGKALGKNFKPGADDAAQVLENLRDHGMESEEALKLMNTVATEGQKALDGMASKGDAASKVLARMEEKGIDAKTAMAQLKAEGDNAGETLGKFQKKGESAEDALKRLQKEGTNSADVMKLMKDHGWTAQEAIERLSNAAKGIPDGAVLETLGSRAFRAAQEAKTLTDALNAVKDAVATGWMKSFEYIFGDYEEAKKLWTDVANELYDIFAEGGNQRNELLGAWHKQAVGGYKDFVIGIMNIFKALKSVLAPVKEALATIFPPKTVADLQQLTMKFQMFTHSLIIGGEESEEFTDKQKNLQKIMEGLFSVIDILKMAFSAVWTVIKGIITVLNPLWQLIGRVALAIADWVKGIRDLIKEGDLFTNFANDIVNFFQGIWNAIAKVFSGELTVGDLFKKAWAKIVSWFDWLKTKLFGSGGEEGGGVFSMLGNALKSGWEWFTGLFAKIKLGPELEAFFKPLIDAFNWIQGKITEWDIGGKIKKAWQGIIDAFEWVKTTLFGTKDQYIGSGAGGVVIPGTIGVIAKAFDWIKTKYVEWDIGGKIKAVFSRLIDAFIWVKEKLFGGGETYLGSGAGGVVLPGSPGLIVKAFDWLKTKYKEWDIGNKLKSIWEKIVNAFNWVRDKLKGEEGEGGIGAFFLKIWGKLKEAFDFIKNLFKGGDSPENSIGKLASFFEKLKEIFTKIKDSFDFDKGGTFIEGAFDWILKAFKVVRDFLGFLLQPENLPYTISAIQAILSLLIQFRIANMVKRLGWMFEQIGDRFETGLGKRYRSWAENIFIFAAAVAILFGVVYLFASMPIGQAIKGMIGVAILIGMLIAAQKMTKLAEGESSAKGFLGMAIAVGILVLIAKMIAAMSWNDIAKGAIGVLAFVGILTAAFMLMKLFGGGDGSLKIKGFISFSIAIGILVFIGKQIAKMSWGDMGKAGAGLISLILIMAIASRAMGKMKFTAGLGFIAIALAVQILVGVALDIVKAEATFDQAVVAFGAVILMILAMSKIGQFSGGLVQTLFTVATVLAVAFALKMIMDSAKGMDTSAMAGMLTAVLALGGILLALAVAMKVFETMGPGVLLGALYAVGTLAIIILGLAGIAALLSTLSGLAEVIKAGFAVMEIIGNGIGKFLGAIVGGVLEGISSGLPGIGTNLSDFMTNAQGFFDGLKSVDAEALTGVANLAEIIIAITAASIIDGIGKLFGLDSMQSFADNLIILGQGVSDFVKVIGDVGPDDVTASANAIKILAEAAQEIGKEGGLLGEITGSQSEGMKGFAEGLDALAPALVSYINQVKTAGIQPTDADASANAIKVLADAAQEIGAEGGILQSITGSQSEGMKGFAEGLDALAPALVSYINQVKEANIGENDANASSAAIKVLADAAKEIGAEGGLVGAITGSQSEGMKGFAEGLDALAPSLVSYVSQIKAANISDSDAASSANAIKVLAEAASAISPEGGVAQAWNGSSSQGAKEFAANLPGLGISLKLYALAVKGIDSDSVSGSASAISMLAAAAEELPKVGGIAQWFSGETNLADFGTKLVAFGKDFATYYTNVSSFDESKSTQVMSAVGALVTIAGEVASTNFTGFRGLGSATSYFGENFQKYYNFISEIDTDICSEIVKAILQILTVATFANGVDFSNAKTVGENLKDFAWRIGTQDGNSFYNSIKGIDPEKFSMVADAMRSIVSMAVEAAGADLSGLATFAEDLGKVGDLGISAFINAFTLNVEQAKLAGESITDAALEGIKSNAEQYGQTGTSYGLAFHTMLLLERIKAKVAGTMVTAQALLGIKSNALFYGRAGTAAGVGFHTKLDAEKTKALTAGTIVTTKALAGVRSTIDGKENAWEKAGNDAGQGFIDGLLAMLEAAVAAAGSLGSAAIAKLRAVLKEHSPSKETTTSGENFGKGFSNGMINMVSMVGESASTLGSKAVKVIKNTLADVNSSINKVLSSDVTPTIRPVVDLTNVGTAAKTINSMMSESAKVANVKAGVIASSVNRTSNQGIIGEAASVAKEGGTVFTYTQNNYSPKALDRLEIYRQTSNQFAQVRRLVEEV